MKALFGLGVVLALIFTTVACDSEKYMPTEELVDTIYLPGDTVIINHFDTVYIVVNDSIVDTVFVPCDTCAFEDCKTLGKCVHKVMWYRYGIMVVIGSDNPHAFGHEIDICITIRKVDDQYEVRLTAWREKVKPNQTLDLTINDKPYAWELGNNPYSQWDRII
jgi:hypothetical protein